MVGPSFNLPPKSREELIVLNKARTEFLQRKKMELLAHAFKKFKDSTDPTFFLPSIMKKDGFKILDLKQALGLDWGELIYADCNGYPKRNSSFNHSKSLFHALHEVILSAEHETSGKVTNAHIGLYKEGLAQKTAYEGEKGNVLCVCYSLYKGQYAFGSSIDEGVLVVSTTYEVNQHAAALESRLSGIGVKNIHLTLVEQKPPRVPTEGMERERHKNTIIRDLQNRIQELARQRNVLATLVRAATKQEDGILKKITKIVEENVQLRFALRNSNKTYSFISGLLDERGGLLASAREELSKAQQETLQLSETLARKEKELITVQGQLEKTTEELTKLQTAHTEFKGRVDSLLSTIASIIDGSSLGNKGDALKKIKREIENF